jgi:hypothetical protein
MKNIPEHEKTFVVLPSFVYYELDGKPVSFKTALENWSRVIFNPTDIVLHPERYC